MLIILIYFFDDSEGSLYAFVNGANSSIGVLFIYKKLKEIFFV